MASRDSSSVSEEELLGVVLILSTLSWLGTTGFFASSSSFWATISKAVLSLGWLGLVAEDLTRGYLGVGLLTISLGSSKVQVLVETQNCLCLPKYLLKYMKKGTLRDISLMNAVHVSNTFSF